MIQQVISGPRSTRTLLTAVVASGLVLAVVVGFMVPSAGASVFALLLAPLGGLLLFTQPLLGMFAMVASLPLEEMLPGFGGATGTRLLGMAVFSTWLAYKIIGRHSWRHLITSLFVQTAVIALLCILFSSLWATYRSLTFVGFFSQFQLFLFALLTIDLATSWKRLDLIAKLLIVAGIVSASLTIHQYFVLGIKRAGDGVAGGVNFTASMLVSTMPFAFYLLRLPKSGWWRFLGLLYIGAGTVAIAVTFSRTSYLILALVMGIYYWEFLRGRDGRTWIILLTAAAVIAFSFIPQDLLQERIATIGPTLQFMFESVSGEEAMAEVRGYHWRVGLTMFRSFPLTGVGYNNFGELFLKYQFDIPGSSQIYGTARSPHSSYNGLLAELGLIGMAIWLCLFGVVARNLVIAWRALRKQSPAAHFYFTQAVTYIFFLQLVYAFALNAHMNKYFWLILALSVALRRLANRVEPSVIQS